MPKTVLLAFGLLMAASPALAFGPGGLARGFQSQLSLRADVAQALPQASSVFTDRYCAAFGACLEGRSIALRAAWKAATDPVMPLDRLALTSVDVDRSFAALRFEISPFTIPAASAAEESVDYGVLTGSVPADQPL